MAVSDNYRSNLARYMHGEIILECDNFRISNDEDNKRTYIVLRNPTVIKLDGCEKPEEIELGHLWVTVPQKDLRKIKRYRLVTKTICVCGRVKGYVYKGSGLVQVGVMADKIQIIEYLEYISKRINLLPREKPTQSQWDALYQEVLERRKNLSRKMDEQEKSGDNGKEL